MKIYTVIPPEITPKSFPEAASAIFSRILPDISQNILSEIRPKIPSIIQGFFQ